MPTVARIGPFRFFFYSNEGAEPAIERIVLENRERFLEAWNEFFGR